MPSEDDRPHVSGMLVEELAAHLRARDVRISDLEARRLYSRALAKPSPHPPRRAIATRLWRALDEHVDTGRLELVERVIDAADGFVKYLFRSPDGALSEAVRIPLHAPGRFTVCLSSQVGCAMGCVFCATGRLGLTRSLRAWEMVAALLHVRDETEGRVSGAVFMGQGEPLHNYDEVIRTARILSHPCGGRIAARAISISTVGLVPQIRRYTREGQPYRLIVSLTSAIAAKRSTLLPIAGRFEIEDVAAAIREYARAARGRVTIAWCVMSGVNTGQDEVDALRALLGDVPLRINLIDVNDARPDGFRRASPQELHDLLDRLQVLGAPIVRRYSGGAEKHAACGMLAATRFTQHADPVPARGSGS